VFARTLGHADSNYPLQGHSQADMELWGALNLSEQAPRADDRGAMQLRQNAIARRLNELVLSVVCLLISYLLNVLHV